MFLRDVLLRYAAAHRAARESQRSSVEVPPAFRDAKDAADRGLRQEFGNLPSPAPAEAFLAVVRGFVGLPAPEVANQVYVRKGAQSVEIAKPSGRARRFMRSGADPSYDVFGSLAWSDRRGEFLAWAGADTLPATDVLFAEALKVLNGPSVVPSPTVQQSMEHARTESPGGAASIPGASAFGRMRNFAVSRTPFVVDSATAAWLTILGPGVLLFYDWEGTATPSGHYDFRAAEPNGTGDTDIYPPPAVAAAIRALRWIANPSHDPSDPTSPPWEVHQSPYTINPFTAPPSFPVAISTWDSINQGSLVTVSSHLNQAGTNENMGAGYFEEADELVWLLERRFAGTSRFRYRYDCAFTIQELGGGTHSDTGNIYLTEVVAWIAQGLKILSNGAVKHEDLPTGLASVARQSEGAFPSNGGVFQQASPSQSTFNRGLKEVSQTFPFQAPSISPASSRIAQPHRWHLLKWGLPRAGGDAWAVAMKESAPITGNILETRVAHRAGDFELAWPPGFAGVPEQVGVTEAGGRLWIHSHDNEE